MKFVTSLLLVCLGLIPMALNAGEKAFPTILRQRILAHGFRPAHELYHNPDEGLVPVGKVLFASKHLSLNGHIACQTCHLSQFGSGDGNTHCRRDPWPGRRA